MNSFLWTLQVLLAGVFGGAGTIKLVRQPAELATTLGGWVEAIPVPLIKLLGALELLAAVGLIVPPLTGIAPVLSPLAASGLIAVMAGAVAVHARRGEYPNVGFNIVLAGMSAVIAWGRFGPYPFT